MPSTCGGVTSSMEKPEEKPRQKPLEKPIQDSPRNEAEKSEEKSLEKQKFELVVESKHSMEIVSHGQTAYKIRVWRTTVACFVHRIARFWRLLIDHRLVLTAFKDAPRE